MAIIKLFLFFLIILIGLNFCSKKEENPSEQILAQIENKQIYLDEFKKRCEFAVRPKYCNGNNYIHKKIMLNSLIAEKLLALESDEKNDFTENPEYQSYILGRKEQTMRQEHFKHLVLAEVTLNDEEVTAEYNIAGRKFKISYITLNDSSHAVSINKQLRVEQKDFNELYRSLTGNSSTPTKEVHWQDPQNTIIHNILFQADHKRGDIIGPVLVNDSKYMFFKIDGWTDRMVMTESDHIDRKKRVVEKLKDQKAWIQYDKIVSQIMRGKKIEFSKSTFKKLFAIVAPIYQKMGETKDQVFNNSVWQTDDLKEPISLPSNLDKINDEPLFKVDGNTWTISDFRNYLKQHPLVFRKTDSSKRLAEQFKLAIVDMIRDYYITQDAYEKGFDKLFIVAQDVNMWSDYLKANYQKYKYLEKYNVENDDQTTIMEKYLKSYVDSLQEVYSSDIRINMDLFEEIELSIIDMVALKTDNPFPIISPSFPLLTNDNRLDYGKNIK